MKTSKLLQSLIVMFLLSLFSFNSKAFGQEKISVRELKRQEKKIEKLHLDTQRSLNRFASEIKSKNNDSDLLHSISELNHVVFLLFEKVNFGISNNELVDPLFLNSLQDAQKTIQKLAEDPISDNTTKMVDYLTQDFNIKMNSSPHGLSSIVTSRIEVVVKAVSGSSFIEGYDVFCNYMWEFNSTKPRFMSNSPTNNASIFLTPGYYVFWVEYKGEVIKKKNAEIGNKQKDTEELIIGL